MNRGRCQQCTHAGEAIEVSRASPAGDRVIRRRLCVHCATHEDTPAMGCAQCFSPVPASAPKAPRLYSSPAAFARRLERMGVNYPDDES